MLLRSIAAASALLVAAPAAATITVVFDGFVEGAADFDATVALAGGTVSTFSLVPGTSGNPLDVGDFTIARNNGSTVSVGSAQIANNSSPSISTSGGVISIDPAGTGPGLLAKGSGLTLTFDNPINAIGFEVEDWATCCAPSDLYIQFGTSAPILVGESNTTGDQYLSNGGAGVFVAAFDDTDTFSQVSFWGDGFGEVLTWGGTVRFAEIDEGSLPPAVPAPGALGLLGLGALLIGARRRRG
ncbi:MAG: PEP-CTERM sorting domain-containing protein [Pacificimonas sp.]|jgi:hypothetical protein|nr:PEP-CTERM sorting domain-containing protein [Pacificimonas sp.]